MLLVIEKREMLGKPNSFGRWFGVFGPLRHTIPRFVLLKTQEKAPDRGGYWGWAEKMLYLD